MARRVSGERENRRAERLDGDAEMGVRENDISYWSRVVLGKKLDSAKRELKKMSEDRYS